MFVYKNLRRLKAFNFDNFDNSHNSFDQNISLIFYVIVKDNSYVRLPYTSCVYIPAQRQYTVVQKMRTPLKQFSLHYNLELKWIREICLFSGSFCCNVILSSQIKQKVFSFFQIFKMQKISLKVLLRFLSAYSHWNLGKFNLTHKSLIRGVYRDFSRRGGGLIYLYLI